MPTEKELRTTIRLQRKHLRELIESTRGFLLYMDSVMKGPATVERGKAIANACNKLDLATQIAERYGLRKGLRKFPA